MEIIVHDLKNLDFKLLKEKLKCKHPSLETEMEFIRRITLIEECSESKLARNYFNGDFSFPILTYVSRYVYANKYNYQHIMGEYYEFISKENKQIPYYKLTLYGHINNSTLRNYVTSITVRYFIGKKKKEDKNVGTIVSIDSASKIKNDGNEKDLIDNPWFNLLIGNKGSEESSSETLETSKKIDFVFSKLPERDVKVIKLMVMHGVSALDAFEELEDDLNKTSKIPTSTWSIKQKQNAMALQKARALKHFLKVINDEKINF